MQRHTGVQQILLVAGGLLTAVLLALAGWQIQRLWWKLDLIERVEQRIAAKAAPIPQPAQWSKINAREIEYLHVQLNGHFLADKTALVQANTVLGPGFWVMTPLQLPEGQSIIVNRGFVAEKSTAIITPQGPVELTGLLRLSEPGGGFLRQNKPGEGRWYSRDVSAIAAAYGLVDVAPFFVDQAPQGDKHRQSDLMPGVPVGGLTVVAFHNNHLVYALTWLGLAMMTVLACFQLKRHRAGPPE
jgi:surfeit locus 1 family protein